MIELNPERYLLTQHQVGQRHFDLVVNPAPVQVSDCVYWVHGLKGNVSIFVFDATHEKLGSIHPPQLTKKHVINSIKVLEVNDQLAA